MRAVRLFRFGGIAITVLEIASGCSCNFDDRTVSCASDLDCGAGLVCDHDRDRCIVPGCTTDKQCGHGRVCNASFQCEAGCRSDDGCNPGLVCFSQLLDTGPSQCVKGCRSDNDCSPTNVCAQRFLKPSQCVEGCRSNADCLSGTFCVPAQSSSGGFSFDDEVVGQCASGCHDDAECSPSELCSNGACHARCEQSSECGTGGYCAALHAFGSVRTDDAGLPLECEAGERCSCVRAPTGFVTPNRDPDGGTDAGSADAGEAAP
jgi:Cys-rich repeat protein